MNDRAEGATLTFVDSSALLRFVFEEGDLTLIKAALGGGCVTSALTTVEVPVAIHSRLHRGTVTEADRQGFLTLAQATLSSFSYVALGDAVQREAVRIAERLLIRTLDALQLASAWETQRRRPRRTLRFCTADHRQADAARALFGDAAVDLLPPYLSGE